jgi:hypothetical protein
LPIEEFSCKVRQGDVVDDAEDMSFPVWAGVLPLPVVPGQAIPDGRLDPKLEVPNYVKNYSRQRT